MGIRGSVGPSEDAARSSRANLHACDLDIEVLRVAESGVFVDLNCEVRLNSMPRLKSLALIPGARLLVADGH